MNKIVLRYLPIFYEDLRDAFEYIRDTLQNEKAAQDLIDATEEAILKRSNNPTAFEKYNSIKNRKYPYYRIYVKNYVVYYVVIPGDVDVMEMRRFLYNKRDKESIL